MRLFYSRYLPVSTEAGAGWSAILRPDSSGRCSCSQITGLATLRMVVTSNQVPIPAPVPRTYTYTPTHMSFPCWLKNGPLTCLMILPPSANLFPLFCQVDRAIIAFLLSSRWSERQYIERGSYHVRSPHGRAEASGVLRNLIVDNCWLATQLDPDLTRQNGHRGCS
jgi:hypothetical protein